MKTFIKLFFVGIFLTIVLVSCSKISGDKFIGTWHNKYGQKELVISKANDTAYKVGSADFLLYPDPIKDSITFIG